MNKQCVLAILVLGSLSLVLTQNIYAVSSFQSCFDVSVTGAALNCTDSGGLATVLDVGLSASDNQSSTTDFLVKLSTIPPDSTSTQLQTANTCQVPTSDGQCQTSTYTEIRFNVSKPILEYTLLTTNGRTRNPFTVPYAYLVYFCPQNSVTTAQANSFCGLINVQSVIYSSPDIPDGTTIHNTFYNATLNEQFIRCRNSPPGIPAPLNVSTTSTNIMTYTFSCLAGPDLFTARYVLEFYSLAPMCQVWEIQNPPSIYAAITINATGQGATQVWTLESIGPGSSKASPEGNIIARIEAVQSPSGNFGQDIPGLIITCTDNDTIPFDMSVPGTPPQINPWSYKEVIDPTFNKTFRLPTPANIQALTGVVQTHAMFMHVNTEKSKAYGENCGQEGVAENIYEFPPPQLYFANYVSRYGESTGPTSLPIPYKDIVSFENILTCVPGFGFSYLGINTTTPCNALGIFLDLEEYMITNDKVLYRIPNLPAIYNPGKPNMWISNGTLYFEPPPKDLTFEVVVSFAGSFVGIGAKVANAQINTALSSCYVSTADGACGNTLTSVNATNCAMYVTVCNTSPPGVYGFYSVQTTCASDSNLAPSSLFQPIIANLPGGNCTLVTIPLIIDGTELGPNPVCTVTIYSNSFSIAPESVINDVESFLCSVNNATNTNLPVPPKYNISSIPILYPNPTPVPAPQPAGKDTVILVICIIAALALASFILLFMVCICLKCISH